MEDNKLFTTAINQKALSKLPEWEKIKIKMNFKVKNDTQQDKGV